MTIYPMVPPARTRTIPTTRITTRLASCPGNCGVLNVCNFPPPSVVVRLALLYAQGSIELFHQNPSGQLMRKREPGQGPAHVHRLQDTPMQTDRSPQYKLEVALTMSLLLGQEPAQPW